ncbi:MAG: hypothetical protein JKY91_04780 [Emcibacter sp.]|nr:hypothetical protein [Emcibacter sp.]MBL4894687.1 hypothetical protein [Emcibacter sp.]
MTISARSSEPHSVLEHSGIDMDAQALTDIRQVTLSNISQEILQISDLVENSMVGLSDDFMNLVQHSRQQSDHMATACDLLQNGQAAEKKATLTAVHDILRESKENALTFHQNVNNMVYAMQFQDRTRQLMQAISVALNILIDLSDTIESERNTSDLKEKITFSEDNKNILNNMIKAMSHKELDQNYILRMFISSPPGKAATAPEQSSDFTDIEFF